MPRFKAKLLPDGEGNEQEFDLKRFRSLFVGADGYPEFSGIDTKITWPRGPGALVVYQPGEDQHGHPRPHRVGYFTEWETALKSTKEGTDNA